MDTDHTIHSLCLFLYLFCRDGAGGASQIPEGRVVWPDMCAQLDMPGTVCKPKYP